MKLSVFVLPVALFAAVQLGGCTPKAAVAPPAVPGGVYRSDSAGAVFNQSVQIDGQAGKYIADFELGHIFRSLTDAHRIYIPAGANGIVTSANNGETWTVLPTALNTTYDVVELGNGTLVASGTDKEGQGYVIRSLDKGKSWEVVLTVPVPVDTRGFQILKTSSPIASIVLSLAIDPFTPDRVYAGSNLGTILLGEQSAKTWRSFQTVTGSLIDTRTGLGISRLLPSPHTSSELLLVLTNGTLLKLNGDTQTTIKIPKDLSGKNNPLGDSGSRKIYDVTYVPGFPNALFAATDNGGAISHDAGKTWQGVSAPIESTAAFNSVVAAVSPTNANRLFLAVNNVVYRSEDAGQDWIIETINAGKDVITDLVIDPTNASNMLAVLQPVRN